jgi:hypothetical protein
MRKCTAKVRDWMPGLSDSGRPDVNVPSSTDLLLHCADNGKNFTEFARKKQK